MDGARLPGMETLRADMEDVLTKAEVEGATGPRNEALIRWLDDNFPDPTPVSILSLNSRRAVEKALAAHGLAERVAHVVGREDVIRGKPDPEGLRLLAEKHGVDASDLLLIGDAETDRLAAERAGAEFMHVDEIGVDWQPPPAR
jgi:phosphoglycolate phosphatase-like HAD superfamily hydrolase